MNIRTNLLKLANDVGLLEPKVAAKPKAVVKSFSWGKLRGVELGNELKAIIHPEDWEEISALSTGEDLTYMDEQNVTWNVTRDGENLTFKAKGIHSNKPMTVPFKDLD